MMPRHAWLWALGLSLGLGGCRARTVTSDGDPIARPEPPPREEAVVVPPGCAEVGRLVLSIEPERLPLTCDDGFVQCSGRATLTVENCIPRAFGFGVMLTPRPWSGLLPGFDEAMRLEPGDVWSGELELHEVGVYEVSLNPITLYDRDGPPIEPRHVTLTVENPARERAEAECRACNGEWGHHGIMQREGCICRTSDGGKPCDDGADCEAACIEVEERAGFRCAEFTTNFGCYTYLPEGWSKQRHRKGVGVAPPRVCAD